MSAPRTAAGKRLWREVADKLPSNRLLYDGILAIEAEAAAPSAPDARLRDALESMVRQFGYWSDSAGGVGTGGLSALEDAFEVLGWDDPHPLPDRRCDEPGCMKDATMGWPTHPGGTGLNGGYRRTCWDHSDIGKARAAALQAPSAPQETEP